MIDLHSHLLPGLDDGAEDLEESLELARHYVAAGTTTVAATPHVSHAYPTTSAEIERELLRVQAMVEAHGLLLTVVGGAEVETDFLDELDADEIARLTLGGRGRFLLLEFPYDGWSPSLPAAVERLDKLGIAPVLAHPERNAVVQAGPQRLAGLVQSGALVQVTAGSLVGRFGRASEAAARSLVATGLAQIVAGDLHSVGGRPTIDEAVRALPKHHVRFLTSEAAASVLAGRRPVPSARAGRRLPWLGGR